MYRWVQSFFDGLFLSRPVLWIPVWGFCLFGYYRAAGVPFVVPARAPTGGLPTVDVGLWILLFSCVVGGVYVVNQMADRDVDACNGGFAPMAHGKVPGSVAIGAAAALGLLPLGLSCVFGRFEIAAACVAAGLLGLVYSCPPTRLSGRPILDFAANACGYGGIAFAVGWLLGGGALGSQLVSSALPYLLLMSGGSISSTLPDYEGDRRCGKCTTAVWLGPGRAHLLAMLLVGLAAVAAVALSDMRALACAMAALPLYAVYLVHPSRRLMEATYKVGGAMTMLVVALSSLPFVMAALVVFAATRVYFQYRFGVAYPSLEPRTDA